MGGGIRRWEVGGVQMALLGRRWGQHTGYNTHTPPGLGGGARRACSGNTRGMVSGYNGGRAATPARYVATASRKLSTLQRSQTLPPKAHVMSRYMSRRNRLVGVMGVKVVAWRQAGNRQENGGGSKVALRTTAQAGQASQLSVHSQRRQGE